MSQIIECLIKRAGGSIIELDAAKYHFKPNAEGDHVCEIADEGHADILLAIDTAYRPYVQSVVDTNTDDNGPRIDLSGTVITEDDNDGDDDGDTGGEGITEKKVPEQPEDEAAERERLATLYLERFGKKPHHMMGVKRIREELGLDE